MGSLVLDFVQPERYQCTDSRLDTKWDLREGGGGKKRRGRVQRSGGWKLTVMGQSSNNYLSFYLPAEIHGSSSHLRALGWWVFFLSSPPPKCLYSSFFFGFHCTMLQSSYCWGGTSGSTNSFEVSGSFGETDTSSLNFKQPDSDRPHCSITATKNSPVVVEIMHELDLLTLHANHTWNSKLENLTEAIQRSESSGMTWC